jgi:acetolactate synthase-1/3 small subunit
VLELAPDEAVERELALITVSAPPERRAELLALAEVFKARVAELGSDALVFEIVGRSEDVDSFEELVRPHGVRELVRTGRIALRRPSIKSAPARQHILS